MRTEVALVVSDGPLKGGVRGFFIGPDRMVEGNVQGQDAEHGCSHVALPASKDDRQCNYDFDLAAFVPKEQMNIELPALVVDVQGVIAGIPAGAWVSVGTQCVEAFEGGDLPILSEVVGPLGVTINHLKYLSFTGEIEVGAD
jgi:hypothetical protein|tara:strand:- start:738 stop:1163 length:426 start_codon:yes stop_codon:yes gene_type:complete